jgi:biopolymer transport protein ExbB/TolQ
MSELHVPREFMPKAKPDRASQTRNGTAIGQAALAILMAACGYLVLIYLQQYFGQGLRYHQMFFTHWTEFLCLALACWSLFSLFRRWRKCSRRAACISHSTFPQGLLQDDDGLNRLIVSLRQTGQKYGDNCVAARAERLIEEFHVSREAASVEAALRVESNAAQLELDSCYMPVRIFAWTIPLLGLIGTVLGIGQALSEFAIFLASGAQKPEEVRAALYQATFNLGAAFEATLVAVLVTMIVSVTYLLLHNREKALLRNLDELCHTALLPLMRKESPSQVQNPGGDSPRALAAQEMVIEQLSLLRGDLASATSHLAEWTIESLSQGNAANEEISRHLAATEALHLALGESLKALLESLKSTQSTTTDPAKPVPRGRKRVGEKREEGGDWQLPFHDQADTTAIRTTLLDLRDSISEVSPVLRQLAGHLREQAGDV